MEVEPHLVIVANAPKRQGGRSGKIMNRAWRTAGKMVVAAGLAVVAVSFWTVHGQVSTRNLKMLHAAITNGDLEAVKRHTGENPDILDARFGNPFARDRITFDTPTLSLAVEAGQYAIAKHLLQSGANPNAYGNNKTALHLAASRGNVEMARLLLKHGADINARGCRSDCTPICVASSFGHLALVKALVEAGADVNLVDSGSCAALYYAACNGRIDIVKYLVSQGADAKHGRGIYSVRGGAEMRGHPEIVAFLDSLAPSLTDGASSEVTKQGQPEPVHAGDGQAAAR